MQVISKKNCKKLNILRFPDSNHKKSLSKAEIYAHNMTVMSLLSLNNISKTYARVKVLDAVALDIMPGDRIALIGDNGAGKTTLLRLIAGSETADPESGHIQLARGTVLGYLEQQLEHLSSNSDFALEDPELTAVETELRELQSLLEDATDDDELTDLMNKYAKAHDRHEAMGGFSFRQRLTATLNAFSLDEASIRRPLEQLSGGERMRVALARLLLRSPDLLLLDEPTNHLDQNAIDWLEDYLTKQSSAVLFVSHDRAFINNVATKTAELNAGKIRIYSGNYSNFLELKELEEKTLARRIDKAEKRLQRQEEITQTMLSHRKITQYHSSEKKELRISEELSALHQENRSSHKRMSFRSLKQPDSVRSRRDQVALEATELSLRFPGETEPLFADLSFKLLRGQHIVLVGNNGCGKTSLLRTLMGELPQTQGSVTTASNLVFGFLGQEANFDNYDLTVLEQMLYLQPRLNENQARSELARFGFSGDAVFQRTGSLSGGERSRLFLCALLQDQPDVLFMDEPTNHLDIFSRELLEDALNEFSGTILAVSHDRYFVSRIADEVWAMLGGGLETFPDFDSYRTAERQADARTDNRPDRPELPEVAREAEARMPEWDEKAVEMYPLLADLQFYPQNRSERRRLVADVNTVLREVEANLSRHEREKSSLEKDFTQVDSGEIFHLYAEILETLEIEELLYLQLMEVFEDLMK